MEDSGFDSGDRVNFMSYIESGNNNLESENSSNEDVLLSRNHVTEKNLNKPLPSIAPQQSLKIDNIDDLLFRNPSLINSTNFQTQTLDDVVTADVLINQKKSHHLHEHNKKLSKINTCKGLQRKLELKVERAKRNFNAHSNEKFNQLENNIDLKKSTTLIPINRLPFPRTSVESQPLVEYQSDNSDDEDVATFFPMHKKPKKFRNKKQRNRDVDTFSIQEMTIIESESDGNDGDKSSDEDDCDSQLNLEVPRTNEHLMDKIRSFLCCTKSAQNMF